MNSLIFKSLLLCASFLFTIHAHAMGKWNETNFQNEKVYLYTPASQAQKHPLMINLHGCAQDPKYLVSEGNWELAAEWASMVVAIPHIPQGGVLMGCWDYYGTDHNEKNKHHAFLISLIQSLMKDESLNIDSQQIFISGLSSGGGEASIIACLRPDLIAGVGLNSSPALGTDMGEISRPSTTSSQIQKTCLSFAGKRKLDLSTQLLSIIVSDQDPIVNNGHSKLNAEGFGLAYQVTKKSELASNTVPPTQSLYSGVILEDDKGPRISYIINKSLGHNWAAGEGTIKATEKESIIIYLQQKYISHSSINYPLYLTQYLVNNRRR